jgi:hypothetical protein
LEAAVLGAQWVADRGDAVLAGAARDLISKIAAVVPERLRPFIIEPSIGAPEPSGGRRWPRHRPDPLLDPQRAKDPNPLPPMSSRARPSALSGQRLLATPRPCAS